MPDKDCQHPVWYLQDFALLAHPYVDGELISEERLMRCRDCGFVREANACSVCHRDIVDPGSGNSPGDHDPAYHVAQAYHYPNYRGDDFVCRSCHYSWPCPTIQEYS